MDQQERAERQARERDEARPTLRSVAFGFVLLIVLALGLATFGQILFRLSEISAKGWP
ncbi:MAG: hypothetical protein JXC32_17805 [Anaerolineae bacterium]|nr:hypothetical protein [Anaerolineae bacterium]